MKAGREEARWIISMRKEYQAEGTTRAKALSVPDLFQGQIGGLGNSEGLEQRGLKRPWKSWLFLGGIWQPPKALSRR